jgi:hypothetical protein
VGWKDFHDFLNYFSMEKCDADEVMCIPEIWVMLGRQGPGSGLLKWVTTQHV